MRRVVLVVLAIIVVATAAVGVTAAVTRTPDSTGVSRLERVISQSWGGNCGSDFCGIADVPIPYTTPQAPEAVDVTATITLTYRTSRGDSASADLVLDDGTPPYERMRPRNPYPLRPSVRATSTTLTWFRRDVPAAGQSYTFHFTASPSGGSPPSSVSGSKLTIVIESWTAGD
jgi:hypothetical protein